MDQLGKYGMKKNGHPTTLERVASIEIMYQKCDRNVITSVVAHICVNHPIYIYTTSLILFRTIISTNLKTLTQSLRCQVLWVNRVTNMNIIKYFFSNLYLFCHIILFEFLIFFLLNFIFVCFNNKNYYYQINIVVDIYSFRLSYKFYIRCISINTYYLSQKICLCKSFWSIIIR